ncbi:methylated-DNA--[protein]-cysteine S-methyltransferase [Candidatus Bathyarchaeota archaeon]|nr:methylated-DNA--[protein]-cysteine S-methyltransferase [Candidatus Bathyarchaeota archaeon]MBS7630004.1 methylated-DNA--[protein]-cysteine S-methyltransferase [Candidatus Bathyarchaeota archaeon]
MEQIYYADIQSPLGIIWVAGTDKGIYKIELNKTEESFLKILESDNKVKSEYKRKEFHALEEMFERYFKGTPTSFNLPLDLRGTDFQLAIWKAVFRIPYGRLSTYKALAEDIGRPRAVRAAGNAVGDNPLPIIIPCHRVIRSDGTLGGYGLGLEVKRYLLNLEGIPTINESLRKRISRIEYPMSRDDLLKYFFE